MLAQKAAGWQGGDANVAPTPNLERPMTDSTEPRTYTNPIIAGDWSDPGVVRVGEDYYSVRSTFGWRPACTSITIPSRMYG